MRKPINPGRYTFDAVRFSDESGELETYALEPLSDGPGFDGYLVPWFTLSDRGTYFVPGSLKRSAGQRLKRAPHLYQHDTWEPIGKHEKAFEDDKGFRVSVRINEDIERGREVLSNLQLGVPLGLSIGVDILAHRSGTEADDEKLNRKTAPDYLRKLPIKELTAITEAEWWESSTVTFAGIATAAPDVIHNGEQTLAKILEAIEAGSLSGDQLAAVRKIVKASEALALAPTGKHRTADDDRSDDIRQRLAAIAAVNARFLAMEIR